MEVHINPEFEKLIPPLSPDEFAQLEANILAEGVRDPLVIAVYPDDNGEELTFLADGHNRYRIAQKHGLTFRTDKRTFTWEDDVVIWMIDNQKGRRNLTDFVKLELAEVKAERLRRKGKEKYEQTRVFYGNQHTGLLSTIDNEPQDKHNTQKEIAADLGWSTGKVAMGQKVMKEAPEEVKQQVRTGEISINQAYKEVKKAEIEQRRAEIREELVKHELNTGEKKYRIIYADPPWKYGNDIPEYVTGPQDYYLLMGTSDICDMPVKDISESNAVLFLWSTSPHLPEAFEVVKAWGFEYKAAFIWDKVKHNMGYYNSVRHELLLVCTRGSCTPDVKKLFDSVVSIERTEHSKKPEYFREIIETIYTHGNKIELFAREAPDGWDVFGNQIN